MTRATEARATAVLALLLGLLLAVAAPAFALQGDQQTSIGGYITIVDGRVDISCSHESIPFGEALDHVGGWRLRTTGAVMDRADEDKLTGEELWNLRMYYTEPRLTPGGARLEIINGVMRAMCLPPAGSPWLTWLSGCLFGLTCALFYESFRWYRDRWARGDAR